MEASSVRRRVGGSWPGGAFSGRRGTLAIAAISAIIAGVLLFVFVQQYKKSVKGTVSTTPVFVATHFIQRGTSADVIATGGLFQRTLVKTNQVTTGAITDTAALHGEVAATNIYPDQQLTAADFTRTNVTIASQLSGNERAIALPTDTAHGLVGYVHAGDYVDLMASLPGGAGAQGGLVIPLDQNVLVLATGGGGGGIGSSNNSDIVIRVTDRVALAAAAAADNGKVWVALRPTNGATDSIGPNAHAGSKAVK
jgi:Flp pilus assembly protein CpaB